MTINSPSDPNTPVSIATTSTAITEDSSPITPSPYQDDLSYGVLVLETYSFISSNKRRIDKSINVIRSILDLDSENSSDVSIAVTSKEPLTKNHRHKIHDETNLIHERAREIQQRATIVRDRPDVIEQQEYEVVFDAIELVIEYGDDIKILIDRDPLTEYDRTLINYFTLIIDDTADRIQTTADFLIDYQEALSAEKNPQKQEHLIDPKTIKKCYTPLKEDYKSRKEKYKSHIEDLSSIASNLEECFEEASGNDAIKDSTEVLQDKISELKQEREEAQKQRKQIAYIRRVFQIDLDDIEEESELNTTSLDDSFNLDKSLYELGQNKKGRKNREIFLNSDDILEEESVDNSSNLDDPLVVLGGNKKNNAKREIYLSADDIMDLDDTTEQKNIETSKNIEALTEKLFDQALSKFSERLPSDKFQKDIFLNAFKYAARNPDKGKLDKLHKSLTSEEKSILENPEKLELLTQSIETRVKKEYETLSPDKSVHKASATTQRNDSKINSHF